MSDATLTLLTLVCREATGQRVEDLLLAHPELASGFTASHCDGHGSRVRLEDEAELVSGHAPRLQIQILGPLTKQQAILALLKQALPGAHLHYWIVPVMETGVLE